MKVHCSDCTEVPTPPERTRPRFACQKESRGNENGVPRFSEQLCYAPHAAHPQLGAEGAALMGHREEMCPGQPPVSLSLSHSPDAHSLARGGIGSQQLAPQRSACAAWVRRPGGPYDLDLSLLTPTPTCAQLRR
jgi:hypothetical protein